MGRGISDTGVNRLTVQEIVSGLKIKRESAGTATKRAHWERLIGLAEKLGTDGSDSVLTRHRWRLRTCSVTDFRGVAGTLAVDFRSEADVTVFHGENGSGKSSLTAAIRMAIEGVVGVTHAGAEIKATKALWVSTDDRHRDAATSKVEVEFTAADDPSVLLRLIADYDGAAVSRSATLACADGRVLSFGPTDPAWLAWDAAVRSAPPVFAYAELADELKAHADLQAWITKCLAMDVASRELDGAIANAVSVAATAERRLSQAIENAQLRIEEVDGRAELDGVVSLTPIAWADLGVVETLDDWRVANDLAAVAVPSDRLPADLVRAVDELLDEFRTLRSKWNAAATALITTEVGQGLVALSRAVDHSHQGSNDESCPLCGRSAPDWRERLRQQSERFAGAGEAWNALKVLLHRSERRVIASLETAMSGAVDVSDDQSIQSHVSSACARLLAVAKGDESDGSLIEAFEALNHSWTDDARSLAARMVRRSDRRAAWRAERVAAAGDLFSVYDDEAARARTHGDWKSARAMWNPFLAELRNDRALKLEGQFSAHLRDMLADVGFRLDRLDVKKNETRIDIADASGLRVELSHLSAGQRNALILAPILAQGGVGLFDFMFIDDPVHAFDEFRVDRLAATLTRIGADRPLMITTHDGRFVEYLRAYLPERYAVVRVRRQADGHVELSEAAAPWTVLFEHAGDLFRQATVEPADQSVVVQDVNALLRMGLDAALESFVHRALSLHDPGGRESALSSFEQASTTTARLAAARTLAADAARFDAAVGPVKDYLVGWSSAVHAGPSENLDFPDQLRDARRCAKALARL
uniref:Nuclease SbcCD subunit C n=1 Tax=Neobacillus citreus TaxID=2833578 RepID=A0A942SWJ8_9BACI